MDTIDETTNDEKTNDENSVIEEKEFDHLKDSAWKGINLFFKELLDISKDTDREATIEGVKKDISFKGHNAWILIFSVFRLTMFFLQNMFGKYDGEISRNR